MRTILFFGAIAIVSAGCRATIIEGGSDDGGTTNNEGARNDGGASPANGADGQAPLDASSNDDAHAQTCVPVAVPAPGEILPIAPLDGGPQCMPDPALANAYAPHRTPPRVKQAVCSQSLIGSYYHDCFATNSNIEECRERWHGPTADDEHIDCASCLVSSDTDARHGALIYEGDLVRFNIAGCVALAEPCNAGCAQAFDADQNCRKESCESDCPITDEDSFRMYNFCVEKAFGVCNPYSVPSGCFDEIKNNPANHPGAQCIRGAEEDLEPYFKRLGAVFCGK